MQAVFVALIAVLGTLGGTTISGLLQRRQDAIRHERENVLRSREQRLGACVALAEALAELRSVQILRWVARRDHGGDSPEYRTAKADAFQKRTTARGALFRFQLLVNDETVTHLARVTLELTVHLHEAASQADLDRQAIEARKANERFVAMASHRGNYS